MSLEDFKPLLDTGVAIFVLFVISRKLDAINESVKQLKWRIDWHFNRSTTTD